MEDLCNAAVKEEAIEVKLKAVSEQWAQEIFTFADHKNRGPVVLKVGWEPGAGGATRDWSVGGCLLPCSRCAAAPLCTCCPCAAPPLCCLPCLPPGFLQPSDTSELMERLEDSLMTLGSMATNRYAAPFRAEVQAWIRCGAGRGWRGGQLQGGGGAGPGQPTSTCRGPGGPGPIPPAPPCPNPPAPAPAPRTRSKLSTASEAIEQWLTVQNMWMYMEAVFSGGDIVKQLPQEAKRFQNIDKNFMKASEGARLGGGVCAAEP